MLFDAYPREALSLLPAVSIWAARAVVEIWTLVRAWRPRMPSVATAAAIVCATAILIGQAVTLPGVLSINTRGYANAGTLAARYQEKGKTIFIRAQDTAFLYIQGGVLFRATRPVVAQLRERPTSVVFMTDLTLAAYPRVQSFFDLNHDRLRVITRVPNGLYPEVFLQPATTYKLSHLNDPPDSFRYITFWQATGPLLFPPDWPP
jgi:hypothetical protein